MRAGGRSLWCGVTGTADPRYDRNTGLWVRGGTASGRWNHRITEWDGGITERTESQSGLWWSHREDYGGITEWAMVEPQNGLWWNHRANNGGITERTESQIGLCGFTERNYDGITERAMVESQSGL